MQNFLPMQNPQRGWCFSLLSQGFFLPRFSFIGEAMNFWSIYKVIGAVSVQTSRRKNDGKIAKSGHEGAARPLLHQFQLQTKTQQKLLLSALAIQVIVFSSPFLALMLYPWESEVQKAWSCDILWLVGLRDFYHILLSWCFPSCRCFLFGLVQFWLLGFRDKRCK